MEIKIFGHFYGFPFFLPPFPSPLPVHRLTWNNTACTSKNEERAGWSSKVVFSLTRATRERHHERITCFCLHSFRPSTAAKKVMPKNKTYLTRFPRSGPISEQARSFKAECNIWRTHMIYFPRTSHFTTCPNI